MARSRIAGTVATVVASLAFACACGAAEPPATSPASTAPASRSREKLWAFAVVTDPEPHTAPADKNALAPFADDLRYLKDTFVTKATPERPRPELVIVPGDIAPAEVTAKVFKEILGEEIPWLPVPGNHDQSRGEAKQMSSILASYEKLGLKWGPAGPTGLQYYFTYRNTLFAGLNIYWDGKLTAGSEIAGDGLTEEGLKWVRSTLAGSAARYKIVYGHRPAWPFGSRHPKDTLAKSPESRDQFWKALAEGGCQLYLCGHTHNYSTYRWLGNEDPSRWNGYASNLIPQALGVWQLDACSVRGTGSSYDRVVVYCRVSDEAIQVETHLWPKALGPKGSYGVPANTDSTLYQFKIFPELKDNVPSNPQTRDATTQPAK